MSHLDLTPDNSVPTQLPSESMTAEATTPNQPANPQPVSQKPAQPTSQSVSQPTSQSSSQSTSQADSMVGLKLRWHSSNLLSAMSSTMPKNGRAG